MRRKRPVTLSTKIEERIDEKLREIADEEQVSIADIVNKILWEALKDGDYDINEEHAVVVQEGRGVGIVKLESVSSAPSGGKVGKRKPKRKKDWEPSEEEIEEWMDMYSLPRKLAIVQIKSRRMDG